MTRSPRETFSTSIHREAMQKISMAEAFLSACDYSLLIFVSEHENPIDPTSAAQIIGARRVLEILKTIGDPLPKGPKAPATLNYNT